MAGDTIELIVEDGTGLADANSYCTVEEADAYHMVHPEGPTWDVQDEIDKKRRLIYATGLLNQHLRWIGVIVVPEQALAFPGQGFHDRAGRGISTDIVPQEVKDATAELARLTLTDARSGNTDSGDRVEQSVRVGSASVTYAGTGSGSATGAKRVIPNSVLALIRHLIFEHPRAVRG